MPLADFTDSPPDDGSSDGQPKRLHMYMDAPEAKKDDPVVEDNSDASKPSDSIIGAALDRIVGRLTGTNGYERYQTWPEKMVREAVSAPHDAMTGQLPMNAVDPLTGEVHTSSQAIEGAQAIAGMAGTGGLSSMTDATLGSTPFLRPALKYGDKIYKAPVNGQHLDAIPPDIYPEFQRQAMSGEDISNFNFGFMNHKGQFLDRQKALDYAIENGLVDQGAGKYGALTSTLMSDSGTPGMAIEAAAKAGELPKFDFRNGESSGSRSVKIGPTEVTYGVNPKNNDVELSLLRTDKDARGQGNGRAAAEQFLKEADANGKRVLLNADPMDKTTSKNKLVDFYKSLGFVRNSGRNKDFSTRAEYIRNPVLKSDNDAGAGIAAVKASNPFFSAVEHAVNNTGQPKMTGSQWLGTLSNKPGVKPEEMQWTGLQDFLKENGDKPVTREQVQEHLANNKVELKEVNKGANLEAPEIAAKRQEFQNLNDKAEEVERKGGELTQPEYDRMHQLSGELMAHTNPHLDKNNATKYHSYQLPGGENYREMLMTLPTGTQKYNEFIKTIRAKHGEGGLSKLPLTDAERATYETRLAGAEKDEDATPYKSSHWDEPNILAHVRMNDRTIDGKKSLHLEEIQSDWHQHGRDKGYKIGDEEAGKKLYESIPGKAVEWKDLTQPQRDIFMSNAVPGNKGVPDAPFKKTWHELALKRMIREAASKGYDRLSWTPGEAQAARYDLSKQIDKVQYHSDKQRLVAFDKNHNLKMDETVSPDKVSDYVGKEHAKKLLDTKPDHLGIHTLENADLKVGGEGMKGFYDKMIPKAVEKISGQKVQTVNLETNPKGWKITPPEHTVSGKWMVKNNNYNSKGFHFDTKEEAEANLAQQIAGERSPKQPVHFIDIPQSLRDTAMHKGFPLFSAGMMFTPIDHDPTK